VSVLGECAEVDSGSTCISGHHLMLVAEGYALCCEDGVVWYPWKLSPPSAGSWGMTYVRGRDSKHIRAWVGLLWLSKDEALAFIQQDIEAHRALPFDEAAERARLMPV